MRNFYNEMYENGKNNELYVGCICRHYITINGVQDSFIVSTNDKINVKWNMMDFIKEDTKIEDAIYNYGWNNFEHKIIDIVVKESKEELNRELERLTIYYIDRFDSYENGFNESFNT